mgnify:FL=1
MNQSEVILAMNLAHIDGIGFNLAQLNEGISDMIGDMFIEFGA